MTQSNTLNVELSNWQLHKLKSEIVICDSNDEKNFAHKLLLTNTQVSKLRKAFANNSSTNIKLWKTQLSKMVQLGGSLGTLLEPLL